MYSLYEDTHKLAKSINAQSSTVVANAVSAVFNILLACMSRDLEI